MKIRTRFLITIVVLCSVTTAFGGYRLYATSRAARSLEWKCDDIDIEEIGLFASKLILTLSAYNPTNADLQMLFNFVAHGDSPGRDEF